MVKPWAICKKSWNLSDFWWILKATKQQCNWVLLLGETIINWNENTEYKTIVSEAMKELKNAGGNPQKAKWLDWDVVKNEWDKN